MTAQFLMARVHSEFSARRVDVPFGLHSLAAQRGAMGGDILPCTALHSGRGELLLL